ncbi:hypothetical protein ACFSTC_25135 [Nonomuraea ferruginea]
MGSERAGVVGAGVGGADMVAEHPDQAEADRLQRAEADPALRGDLADEPHRRLRLLGRGGVLAQGGRGGGDDLVRGVGHGQPYPAPPQVEAQEQAGGRVERDQRGGSAPAARLGRHRLGLDHRIPFHQVGDDGEQGRTRQSGALGELGAAQRARRAQRGQHGVLVHPPQPLQRVSGGVDMAP